jgi:tetratricopeptide (TPR) repeat protein
LRLRLMPDRRFAAGALVLMVLAACGGTQPAPAPEPPQAVDPDLMSGWRLARAAFERGQYEQAAALYERVLAEAYARDDLKAIGEIGYELAVVQLRQGRYEAAAAQARGTREELVRRDQNPFAELYLVEAVALYGSGDGEGALASANAAIDARPNDPRVTGRAEFVRGAVAADNEDVADLEAAISRLEAIEGGALRADRLELLGRLRLLEREPTTALASFKESAGLRQEFGDYVGMARALAFAAEAAEAVGREQEAADLFFRAGRSAAAEGREPEARLWLQAASRLATGAGTPGIRADAEAILKRIGPPQD